MSQEIEFIVPGQAQASSAAAQDLRGTLVGSVRVGARRGGGDQVRLSATLDEDIVVLSIANGPTLVLRPDSARDLMRAQVAGAKRSAADDGAAVEVPAQLGWPGLEAEATRGATRGWLGEVVLSGFDIVKGVFADQGAKMVAAAVTQSLDARVEAGVYALSPDKLEPLKGSGRRLDAVSAAPGGAPLLVLVHGTFVDTVSTFGKLWTQHADVVGNLFAHYGGRVYALDHPTLTASPIANALTLVDALPDGARLHLLTHSRGGMVAEVLARACSGMPSADELALFDGEGYGQHRQDLQALAAAAAKKGLKVERMLRVACPARGTLLASRRLDAYLSVLKWGLELAGLPVVPELVDFLNAVAQRRTEPAELPGLEAMTPDSPVVQWLNAGGEPIAGQLRVLAGDIEGDSITSWVKTLLADAFYWTDNDLVVQTRSMYGGAQREPAGATFVLDRGAKVSHFNYFANDRSVQAIVSGLTEPQPPDFRTIGPLSWAGRDASGTRAAVAIARSRGPDAAGAPAEARPAVVLLPGILGSNLALDGKRIWLGLRLIGGLKRLAWDPATASHVTPDGPIGLTYDDLIEYLAQTHEVIEFAFDWRRPIEDEARRLAGVVDGALQRRDATGQPVRLLAHSMGGLVARTMQLVADDVWRRMMDRSGARLLMLGTPNAGSWAPMQVLSGDDTFGNTLVAFGGLFDDAGTRAVMAAMPGFIQLQAALTDPALGLDSSAKWQALADEDIRRLKERSFWHWDDRQIAVYRWSAPPQGVLDQAVALRRRLDEQATKLGADAQKMLLVVGHDKFTPAGCRMTDDGLEYLDAADGDGRVPLQSALLPGVRTWRCDAAHGKLPDVADAFAAYVELLNNGETGRLPALDPAAATRGGAAAPAEAVALVPNRPSRGRLPGQPPSLPSDLYARDGGAVGAGAPAGRLSLEVLNANLKFVAAPLMLGHYVAGALAGSERVVDALIGGTMAESLRAGLYPADPGTHQVFLNLRIDPDNPLALPRPRAVIVVGLGEEGRLRAADLSNTVRQGVLAYAQRESEQRGGGAAAFDIAATLIGSGGIGIDVGGAARAIAQGAADANRRLRGSGWPVAARLQFVELFLDRASEAHRALAVLVESRPAEFALAPAITPGIGAMRRPSDSSYRGVGYDFITAVQSRDAGGGPVIEYILDTQRARNEVRGQQTQAGLVDALVRIGADANNLDPQIGRSLFQLLVPVEIEPFLAGSTSVVLQLDANTAAYPWELLDTPVDARASGRDRLPWAVRTQVLRKLRTDDYRALPAGAGREGGMLVIGEPKVDPARFAELPGARREAAEVGAALGVKPLLGPDALAAVNALLAGPLRIVHVSGHGEIRDDGGGVVLSDGAVLGPNEIRAMRWVPELVFVNCCFIGQVRPDSKLPRNALGAQRPAFAAGVAAELIKIGVRCVVAAGWAVEDDPAMLFARRFYQRLLAGDRFVDAVGQARLAAYEARPAGNTWAAYQCYGDPDWRWLPPDDCKGPAAADVPTPASAPALALVLENEALDARHADDRSKQALRRRLDKLRALQARYQTQWGGIGAVAEAFGLAYAECRDLDAAVDWYRRAAQAADGSASMKAVEQYGNLLARRGAERARSALEKAAKAQQKAGGTKAEADDAQARSAQADAQAATAAARADIGQAIERLRQLYTLQPTAERANLLGSACKRLALVADGADAQAAALRESAARYAQAESIVRATGADDLFYPIMNALAVELRLAGLTGQPYKPDAQRIAEARRSLQAKVQAAPDFWSAVGLPELRMLEALADGQLAAARDEIVRATADLALRAPAKWMWSSVYEQAQFLLAPYVADTAEGRAAAALIAHLRSLAA